MSREYPSDWDTRRKRVYRRDNYRCQNCSRKGGNKGDAELHAHHVVPKSKGGTHELSNLKTLCSECHDAVHRNTIAPTGRSNNKDSDVLDVDISNLKSLVSAIVFLFLIMWIFQQIGFAKVLYGFTIVFGILSVISFLLAVTFGIRDGST